MDSVLVGSFPDTSSITTGGNLRRSENCAKNYCTTSQLKRKIQKEYNFLRFRQPSLKHLFKGIERGSTYQECNRKNVVKATFGPSFESDPHAYDPKNILDSVKNFMDAFSKFCTSYAYADIGSVLSIISASLLAVEKLSDISPLFFTGVLQAVVPNLLMVIYINGLNQLCDVKIDKINKPYLPLASGKISFATGVTIIASCLILSFWQSWIVGSMPSIWALILIFVLWTAYSINVPLLRWKRYPVLAAMCIFATWAFIYPIGYFFHMQTFVFKRTAVFSRPLIFVNVFMSFFSIAIALFKTFVFKRTAVFSRPLIFVNVFMSFFSIAIALFKDIPDIEGDQAFGIRSFSARLGQKRVFWICVSLIEMAFGVALVVGATSFCLWSKIVTGLGHAVLASFLLYRARSVDLKNKASIASFYMFIWKLLWAEYLLFPLVR